MNNLLQHKSCLIISYMLIEIKYFLPRYLLVFLGLLDLCQLILLTNVEYLASIFKNCWHHFKKQLLDS